MEDFESVCVRASSEEKEGSGRIGVVVNEMFVNHLDKRWRRCLDACGDGLVDGFEETVEKSGRKAGLLAFVTYFKSKILKVLRCLRRCPCVQMALA